MIAGDILTLIAAYVGRSTSADLVLNSVEAGYFAINSARRKIEKARDFQYSRVNATLAVGSSGGLLTDAYVSSSLTVTGTLSPNIATTFAVTGTYNAAPFYTATVSGTLYFLYFTGTAWQIRPGAFSGSNGWNRTTTTLEPAGTYTATGSSTGTATVTGSTAALSIKRVTKVRLPISSSNYIPIEFMTSDEWDDRVRRQIGRQTYTSADVLATLGVSNTNPVAYQQGQYIYIVGSGTFSFPISAQLEVIRFMPDYSATTDHDYFCDFAPEFLMWQGVIELNNFYRRFVKTEEGSIDDKAAAAYAQEALERLIAWDESIAADTSTPPQPTK